MASGEDLDQVVLPVQRLGEDRFLDEEPPRLWGFEA
jgi:hypothetical protein